MATKKRVKAALEFFLNKGKDLDQVDISKVSNIYELFRYWNNTSPDSKAERLVEQRMAEVLFTISNINELIGYWMHVSFDSNKAKQLIKQRITDILKASLPTITNMSELIEYWKHTSSGSKTEQRIEQRMAEILSTVSSIRKLAGYWSNAPSVSEVRRLIARRMAKVLDEVSEDAKKLPAWFVEMAEGHITIPPFLREVFTTKAEAIYQKL